MSALRNVLAIDTVFSDEHVVNALVRLVAFHDEFSNSSEELTIHHDRIR